MGVGTFRVLVLRGLINFYCFDGHSTVYFEIFNHGHEIDVILKFYC